jgi:PAS domain-containing protein
MTISDRLSADELELRVQERTAELDKANQMLHAEILERKRTEKALQKSEERYRSLYENSLDGILLTRPDGTILSANPQA